MSHLIRFLERRNFISLWSRVRDTWRTVLKMCCVTSSYIKNKKLSSSLVEESREKVRTKFVRRWLESIAWRGNQTACFRELYARVNQISESESHFTHAQLTKRKRIQLHDERAASFHASPSICLGSRVVISLLFVARFCTCNASRSTLKEVKMKNYKLFCCNGFFFIFYTNIFYTFFLFVFCNFSWSKLKEVEMENMNHFFATVFCHFLYKYFLYFF